MFVLFDSHVHAITEDTVPDISHTVYMSVLLDSHMNALQTIPFPT